ncbi:hypothetical protein YC2023_066422 [Brassica napus]
MKPVANILWEVHSLLQRGCIQDIGGVWEIMVDGAKIGIGLYGRTYGWYGPYGHDQPKTYQVDHLSTFEECAILGHKVYGHDIRTAKSDHVLGDKARRRACETIQGRKIHLAYSKMP